MDEVAHTLSWTAMYLWSIITQGRPPEEITKIMKNGRFRFSHRLLIFRTKLSQFGITPNSVSLVCMTYIFKSGPNPDLIAKKSLSLKLATDRRGRENRLKHRRVAAILLGLWNMKKRKIAPWLGCKLAASFAMKFGPCSLNNNTVVGLCAH